MEAPSLAYIDRYHAAPNAMLGCELSQPNASADLAFAQLVGTSALHDSKGDVMAAATQWAGRMSWGNGVLSENQSDVARPVTAAESGNESPILNDNCDTSQVRKILFPVDFTKRCIRAAVQVSVWTKQLGSDLTVLHVVDPADYFAEPDAHMDEVNHQLPAIEERRTLDLKYFCEHYLGRQAVKKLVARGPKVGEILFVAKKEKVDLLMLSHDHQTLPSRVLHDSLTARILNESPVPVWISEHSDVLTSVPPKRILCPVHIGTELTVEAANERLLDFVRVIAAAFSATVMCLYVDQSGQRFLTEALTQPGREAGVSERLANIREKMSGVAQLEIAAGDVNKAIRAAADRIDADLIVMGRAGPGTVGFGVQTRVLMVDHVTQRPVVSVF